MDEKNTTLGEETAKKITEKPVIIRKYKGHIIKYRTGLFFAEKSKEQALSHSIESSLILMVDKRIKEKEEQRAVIKKQKELEGLNKKLSQARVIVDGEQLKKMLQAITSFAVEVDLIFDKNKMMITTMDPANVALIHREVFVKGKGFQGFKIGINANNILSFLREAAKKGEPMTMSFQYADGSSKRLLLANGFGKVTFPLNDSEKEVKIPELKFDATVSLITSDMNKIINLAYTIAESITFHMKDNKFHASAIGDFNMMETPERPGKGVDCKGKYSIEYLRKNFFDDPEESLKIEFSKDFPLKIADSRGNYVILAPRVDSE